MSSGALTPQAAVEAIYHDALHHLDEPIQISFLKNIAGAIQLSLAGLTSLRVAGGSPSIHASNPGLTDLLEGSIFAVGLIFVYMTGAELITGYPMWLAIAALKRKRRPRQYVTAVVVSFVGNLVGALFTASVFTHVTENFKEEPWRGFVVEQVEKTIVHSDWHVIFLKSVLCGYLVTLAMLMGTQNMDGVSKALALWLPFALSGATQFPHTVKYMHFAPTAMMLGANLTIWDFFYRCMLPIFLGNTVGGGLFTGAYHWWVYLQCNGGEKKTETTFSEIVSDYRDEDED